MNAFRSKQPMVRAGVIHAVASGILRSDPEARPVLRDLGFEPERFADTYAQFPLQDYLVFFERAADRLGRPYLGLQLSRAFRPEDLGPVGLLFMMAPNLRTALDRLITFEPAWQESTETELRIDGGLASLSYRLNTLSIRDRRQDAEFSIGILCQFFRLLLGSAWRPVQVHFEHAAPDDRNEARRLLDTPVLYSQGANEIVFETADLDRAVSTGNTVAAPFIERHLQDLLPTTSEPPLSERVSRLISSQMGRKSLSLAELSRQLGLSHRTLQRRLQEEGVTLRDLVRRRRQQLAEAVIEGGRTPLCELAISLGYGDASTLSRAFKSWTGKPPRHCARERRAAATRARHAGGR